jgi:hypothetical protein
LPYPDQASLKKPKIVVIAQCKSGHIPLGVISSKLRIVHEN